MSERRFTRLKASLSKETAAKTRETVSRELRQSLNANQESFLYCIDSDYERSVRKWNELYRERRAKQQAEIVEPPVTNDIDVSSSLLLPNVPIVNNETITEQQVDIGECFMIHNDDIQCCDEDKPNKFEFHRYFPKEKTKISSPFSRECIQHYVDSRHTVRYRSMDKYFGSVYDTFVVPKSSNQISSTTTTTIDATSAGNASSSGHGLSSSKNFLSGFTLKPHIFECDEEEYDFGGVGSGRRMLIREGSASVIDDGEGDFLNGWLTLTRDEYNCFLTFYGSALRDKIVWHIEVTQKVSAKLLPSSSSSLFSSGGGKFKRKNDKDNQSTIIDNNNYCCFKVTKHLIYTDQRYLDDWIKDINSNIKLELSPVDELRRILGGDNRTITETMKSSALIGGINLFAAYNDLNYRKGNSFEFKEPMFALNQILSKPLSSSSSSSTIYRFILTIKSFDLQPNERNRSNDSYFGRISLFDSKLGKISEEFRYVVSQDIRSIRPSSIAVDQNRGYDQRQLCTISRALFTVNLATSQPNDLYLVLRIERSGHRLLNFNCLPATSSSATGSGSNSSSAISASASAAANNNNKVFTKSIILQHSEPYAWSIRPLFSITTTTNNNDSSSNSTPTSSLSSSSVTLETSSSNFGLFYKMDHNRLSDDFINNILNQHSQCPSRSQTSINGRLEIELMEFGLFQQRQQQQPLQQQHPQQMSSINHHFKSNSNLTSNNSNNSTNKLNDDPQQTSSLNDVLLSSSLFIDSSSSTPSSKSTTAATPLTLNNPILEIQPLRLQSKPFTRFFDILYIYPQNLKFDSQKVFSKARNLCVTVEIRDTDDLNEARPLRLIFGRPNDQQMFVTSATTSISRHNVTPDYFEEFKISLPLDFTEKLHILFTFSHVSCKKECTYSVVGYSWLPISPEKRQLHCQNQLLSVFASLPNGYLSCQALGLGKGLSMPDVKTVGKDLFKVSLILTSSVISRDVELQNTLCSIIKITRSNRRDDSKEISQIISLERNLPKMLRYLTTFDCAELIHFSQIILQQLFKLLVFAASQELIVESFNTIIRLVESFKHDDGDGSHGVAILNQFIDETFITAEFCGVYIHDQLFILLNKQFGEFVTSLTSSSATTTTTTSTSTSTTTTGSITDEIKLLLNNLWFILRIVTKSMVQYLVATGRHKLNREERFDPELVQNLKCFVESTSGLIATFSRLEEARRANQALAHFLARLCSFFDRSLVFNSFYHHVSILSSCDVLIQEFKLQSIAILLSHEHLIAYCNPLVAEDTVQLTSEFCRRHFPIFLLLTEFKNSYSHSIATTVRIVRQMSLSIVRNQLAKHLLDDRYSEVECRERVLRLYLPILTVILENTNRMIDSTIATKDGQYHSFGRTIATTTMYGNNSNTSKSGATTKSTVGSPFSTIHEHNSGTDGLLNSLLVRSSSSEVSSSTLSSVSSFGSLSSNSTLTQQSLSSNNHHYNHNHNYHQLHHNRNSSISTITGGTVGSISTGAGSNSGGGNQPSNRYDNSNRFSPEEVRDLFICELSVVQILDISRLNLLNKKQIKELFLSLECALNCFEYKPQNNVQNQNQNSQPQNRRFNDNRSKTLPNPAISGSSGSAATLSALSSASLQLSSLVNGDHHHHHQHHYPYSYNQHSNDCHATTGTSGSNSNNNILTNYLLQQNLSIQSALITLRTIHLYLDNDKEPIDQAVVSQILSIYLTLMTLPQSQSVLINVFDSVRYFVQKFALLLFQSDAFLSPIISKVIKYCNSSLTPIRQCATDLLYCLFSTNMKRTRFETIVCVSRLASSDLHGLLYLHSSLNRIEMLSLVDSHQSTTSATALQQQTTTSTKSTRNDPKRSSGTTLSNLDEDEEVSIIHIVGRIREILKATKQIREESFDPYLASELRLQLANSYSRTSRSLLRTWLENLSEVHVKNKDWAEAALCLCQVIAILIEQLSSKEIDIVDGMFNICKVSENISAKDSIKKESDWLELEESHVSIDVLEQIIGDCFELLEKAELFELAPHVLKVMISIHEKEYDHKKLSLLYTKMAKMHSKAQEINDSGKRLFDTFFRVAFYYSGSGQKSEYIYKVSKVVSLAEMTTKLQQLYQTATFVSSDSVAVQQLESRVLQQQQQSSIDDDNDEINTIGSGGGNVTLPISDQNGNCLETSSGGSGSGSGSGGKLFSNCSIVITHVNPYVENARNLFEKNVGVQQFVYEQRLNTKIAHSVAEQYKKRVILTTEKTFPYFLKRIPVVSKQEVILSPIEVAIDEMQERVHQLEHVINTGDAKHLQLVLQGSVHVTVNCGPIAYANAFLKVHPIQDSQDTNNNQEPNSDQTTSENGTINIVVSDDQTDSLSPESKLEVELNPVQNGGDYHQENNNDETDFSESQKHLRFLFEQFLDLCESALKLNEKLIKPNQVEYHSNLKANFEKLKSQLDFCHDRPTSVQIFDVISGTTYA